MKPNSSLLLIAALLATQPAAAISFTDFLRKLPKSIMVPFSQGSISHPTAPVVPSAAEKPEAGDEVHSPMADFAQNLAVDSIAQREADSDSPVAQPLLPVDASRLGRMDGDIRLPSRLGTKATALANMLEHLKLLAGSNGAYIPRETGQVIKAFEKCPQAFLDVLYEMFEAKDPLLPFLKAKIDPIIGRLGALERRLECMEDDPESLGSIEMERVRNEINAWQNICTVM
jgi:hypothetical protein